MLVVRDTMEVLPKRMRGQKPTPLVTLLFSDGKRRQNALPEKTQISDADEHWMPREERV